VNAERYASQAEIFREKAAYRSRFFRRLVDKDTRNRGSSFQPGELTAAFLWAQFEEANRITRARLDSWNRYHDASSGWKARAVAPAGRVRRFQGVGRA
jgi:dTDP-4-amino-4,6-dideoxygalactose transaminase